MSPELLLGKGYDEKVDVYSFAICLWECLTGQIPFEGVSIEQLIYLVVSSYYL